MPLLSFSLRMIVAAFVSTNPSADKLRLRHTTVMPNIPALPMLCCLAFSPMVELRCNPTYTKYCGALCGLGYDKRTKKSHYQEHDVEIAFDFDIDNAILILINKIRYWLNAAVNPSSNINDAKHIVECTTSLQKYLKMLVEVPI